MGSKPLKGEMSPSQCQWFWSYCIENKKKLDLDVCTAIYFSKHAKIMMLCAASQSALMYTFLLHVDEWYVADAEAACSHALVLLCIIIDAVHE